ncbi:MAG TPA: DUF4416 family protein [Deltaproteobacteria bacterium]|nr:DUF4416 family protein [Deltaproteobacteria bacterium]
MGVPATPCDVMLFCSVLFHDAAPAGKAIVALKDIYGEAIYESDPMPFDFTTYYEGELGSPLYRILIAFHDLVPRDSLPASKLKSNAIEETFTVRGKRSVNLDPGILSLENICLATTKPYSHRIYLGSGIWGEVTLMYQKDSYRALPWTYPDYASSGMIKIFNSLREQYKEKSRCRGA